MGLGLDLVNLTSSELKLSMMLFLNDKGNNDVFVIGATKKGTRGGPGPPPVRSKIGK